MRNTLRRGLALASLVGLSLGSLAGVSVPRTAGAASDPPRWLLHVQRYPGGLSSAARQAAYGLAHGLRLPGASDASRSAALGSIGANVQVNDDSTPPMPQNTVSVAYDAFDPMIAVATSIDFASSGFSTAMHTTDGGVHWESTPIAPSGSTGACIGGDAWVAFSRRDRAFYVGQECFTFDGSSEMQIIKSIDGGRTWTPPGLGATLASNVDPATGSPDTSLFYDRVAIAIDNTPSSPHYGRIYATYVKFHLLQSGFSDYCPVQLAYTDRIPTNHPFNAAFSSTPVVPDDPGDNGKGASANQDAEPAVERDGTLDVSYALEDCNTAKDRHLKLQKSTDGGRSFLDEPIRIDRPGEFVDNPHLRDKLPPTRFGAGVTPSFEVNPDSGELAYAYLNDANEKRSGTDVSIQFSSDGGYHWTSAQALSVTRDGAPAPQDQFFPAISADPAGRWHAIWYDRRRDPDNVRIDTFQADWTGAPSTFHNYRISTSSWNPNRGYFRCGCSIGDYIGLAAANAVIYPVWADGRDSAFRRTGIGETDIFTNIEIRR